ncbi:MAG: hypothetical protein LBD37_06375 [Treponema sp.]|jgi:hypothetical protein|nr:hypothetical protein [Treponema sp.]
MKNKRLLPGMSGIMAAALAVLCIGCADVQEITGEVGILSQKADPVDRVTAQKTNNGEHVILTWYAVDNVETYRLYIQEGDKKTILPGSAWQIAAQNEKRYANDGAESDNTDIDWWSARIPVAQGIAGKRYRFGVRVHDFDSRVSDIVWSNYSAF